MAAIPEITRDGETGFIVPTGDVAALKAALQRLILQPELRLQQGAQAAAYVQQRFDARQNAAQLLSLLKQIADEAQSTR
ncbi:MAG: glycosyltransferase [Anaerolineae bacterium]